MSLIKDLLFICSFFFVISVLAGLIGACAYVVHSRKSQQKVEFRVLLSVIFGDFFFPRGKIARPVCIFIAVIGLINIILGFCLKSRQIGDFYELPSYTEDYEAALRVNHTVIDCIARVEHSGGNYFIDRLYLPFDHTRDIDIEYDAKSGSSFFCLGDNDSECLITLIKPATVISRANLAAEDIVSFGPYCASVYSSVYHLRGCPYTSGISSYSLRYFPDRDVAEVLGFAPCSKCNFY